MARLKFTLKFATEIETEQKYLKLTRFDGEGNELTVNPTEYSPQQITELINNGEVKVQLVESLLNSTIVESNVEADYNEIAI
jgi:hypothetical protein